MALFGKRRFLDEPAPIDPGDPSCTLLARELCMEGDIHTPGDAVVAGQIEGTLRVGRRLHLMEEGIVKGTLTAGEAKIDGTIEGPVNVLGRLEVGSKARIAGDLKAARIAIAEGAVIEGGVHSSVATTTFVEKRGAQQEEG